MCVLICLMMTKVHVFSWESTLSDSRTTLCLTLMPYVEMSRSSFSGPFNPGYLPLPSPIWYFYLPKCWLHMYLTHWNIKCAENVHAGPNHPKCSSGFLPEIVDLASLMHVIFSLFRGMSRRHEAVPRSRQRGEELFTFMSSMFVSVHVISSLIINNLPLSLSFWCVLLKSSCNIICQGEDKWSF